MCTTATLTQYACCRDDAVDDSGCSYTATATLSMAKNINKIKILGKNVIYFYVSNQSNLLLPTFKQFFRFFVL